jgi:hypothetical protein
MGFLGSTDDALPATRFVEVSMILGQVKEQEALYP